MTTGLTPTAADDPSELERREAKFVEDQVARARREVADWDYGVLDVVRGAAGRARSGVGWRRNGAVEVRGAVAPIMAVVAAPECARASGAGQSGRGGGEVVGERGEGCRGGGRGGATPRATHSPGGGGLRARAGVGGEAGALAGVQALEKMREQKFAEGRAPVCATGIREISAMGAGIALHLELQRAGFVLMLAMTVLALPSLLVCYSGQRLQQEDRDALYFNQLSLANVGFGPGSGLGGNATTEKTITVPVFGRLAEAEQGLVIAWSDLACSLLFLGFIAWFRHRINELVTDTDKGNVTPADYAMLVRGLPRDATEREIMEHFDRLYSLWDEDWVFKGYYCGLCARKGARSRRPQWKPETEATLEEARMAREREDAFRRWETRLRTTANPVADPRNAPPRKRPLYAGKWVSEVAVAHPNGELIRRFQAIKNMTRKLEDAVEEAAYLKFRGQMRAHEAKVKEVESMARDVFRTNTKSTGDLSLDCVGAFVMFENEESRERCEYDASVYSGGCCGAPRPLRFRKVYELEITSAPEPSNVIWENFEVSDRERMQRTLAVAFVVFVLLVISTAIVVFFQRAKTNALDGVPDVSVCAQILPTVRYGSTALVPGSYKIVRNKTLEWPALEGRVEDLGLDLEALDDTSLLLGTWDGTPLPSSVRDAPAPQCLDGRFHLRFEPPPAYDAWRVPIDASHMPVYVHPFFNESRLPNTTDLDLLERAYFDAFDVQPLLADSAVKHEVDVNRTVLCQNPCVSVDSRDKCPTLTSRTYPANSVAGCYCIQVFSDMIESDGLQAAIQHMRYDESDLCLAFIQSYGLAQSLAIGAAVLVVVINLVLQQILSMLTHFEKHNSVSDEESALALKIFVGQLINTAFIVLLVNAEIRMRGPAEVTQYFSGQFSSFSPRWFSVVGVGITLTMLTNIVVPHISPLLQACCVRPCLRICHRRAITQDRLNTHYKPPEFLVAARYPVILNNIFVTMLYSAGMPMLIPIAAVSFFVSYFVDKTLILRFYSRPRGTDASLARLALKVMPVALMLHLAFTIYMFGDSETVRSRPLNVTPLFGGDVQEDFEGIVADGSKSSSFAVSVMARLTRENTAGHVLLLALLLALGVLTLTAGQVLVLVLRQVLIVITCGRCGGNTLRSEEELLPPYTGEFYQALDRDEDPSAIGSEASGWALRPDPYRGGDYFMKVKLWTEAGESEGKFHDAGDPKSTWEVVRDSIVHSYRIEANPQYKDAVRVMKMTLLSLGVDLEAHDMSLPEAAVVADDRRGDIASVAPAGSGDKYLHEGSLAPREAWGDNPQTSSSSPHHDHTAFDATGAAAGAAAASFPGDDADAAAHAPGFDVAPGDPSQAHVVHVVEQA
jgi:hypothetical protein